MASESTDIDPPTKADLQLRALPTGAEGWRAWSERVAAEFRTMIAAVAAGELERALASLEQCIVLTPFRQGGLGTEALNRRLIEACFPGDAAEWPVGTPVICGQNAPRLGLWNGDTGLCLADGQVAFPAAETPRRLALAEVPGREPAFAITAHRSQGSEYQAVHLVLPPEPHPLLSRELLYTAASRARQRLTLYGSPDVLRAAIERPEQRGSGLVERLHQPGQIFLTLTKPSPD